MIQIDMQMPEKCGDCIFCDDHCSCVASDYNGTGINVGCAYRTDRRDIRCPLKEQPEIIRCKDCKFYQKPEYGFTKGDCTYGSVWYQTEEDGFCSKAKVKD